jgi:hypothetical protein
MGFLDSLHRTNIVNDPASQFDRTNIGSGILQARAAITQALAQDNPFLDSREFPAIALWVSEPSLVTSMNDASSPILPQSPATSTAPSFTYAPTMQIKIYFRVPILHSNIPLPSKFSSEAKNSLSKLKPEDRDALLISCHPFLYADFEEFSGINAGDQIEIRFDDKSYSSAKIIKAEKKGPNNIGSDNNLTAGFTGISNFVSSIVDLFDDEAEVAILGSPSEPTSLGKNQAKFYTEATRGPNEITNIVMHSTDGHSGDGRAQKTIDRFAEGPTLRFDWIHPDTGETIINPSCTEVLKHGQLPENTVCQETRNQVEIPVKTSIHYAIDQGGNVIQGVLNKDIASHAGGSMNKVSIGIEMNGEPAVGPGLGLDGKYAKMYNEALINATAQLVAKITTEYNIPVVRATKPGQPGIVAHHDISSTRFDPGNNLGWAKKDIPPGKYWDWDDFLTRVKNYQGSSA